MSSVIIWLFVTLYPIFPFCCICLNCCGCLFSSLVKCKLGDFLFVPQVGDGTTTVVLLAGEFLKEAKPFVDDGVHPQNLIRSYRTASSLVRFEATVCLNCGISKPLEPHLFILLYQAIEKIKELATSIEGKSLEEKKSLLAKCAATTLSSKLIGGEKEFFATMVVDAVIAIGNEDRLNMIGMKKVHKSCF